MEQLGTRARRPKHGTMRTCGCLVLVKILAYAGCEGLASAIRWLADIKAKLLLCCVGLAMTTYGTGVIYRVHSVHKAGGRLPSMLPV